MVQNPTHYIILYDIPTTLRQDTNWMVPKSIKKSTPKRIYSIYLHKHQVVQNRCSQNPLKERTGWRYGGSTCTNIGKSGPTIYVKIRPNVCWCGIKMAQHAAFFGWWSLSLSIYIIYIYECVCERKRRRNLPESWNMFFNLDQFGNVPAMTPMLVCHHSSSAVSWGGRITSLSARFEELWELCGCGSSLGAPKSMKPTPMKFSGRE